MGPHGLIPRAAPDGAPPQVDRALVRRVWGFARPYRGKLALFLGTIVGSALLALVPPLLIKAIIDDGIANKDRHLVTTLAIVTVLVAVLGMVLDLVQRWYSSVIGEGLIFDLRVGLFDH